MKTDLLNCAKLCAKDGFAAGGECFVSMRIDDGMLINRRCNIERIKETDILEINYWDNADKEQATHLTVYRAYPKVNVILHIRSPFASAASETGCAVRPVTADGARAIGAKLGQAKNIPSQIADKLACGVALADCQGAFIAAHSIDEGLKKARAVERACRVYITACAAGEPHIYSGKAVADR